MDLGHFIGYDMIKFFVQLNFHVILSFDRAQNVFHNDYRYHLSCVHVTTTAQLPVFKRIIANGCYIMKKPMRPQIMHCLDLIWSIALFPRWERTLHSQWNVWHILLTSVTIDVFGILFSPTSQCFGQALLRNFQINV